MNIWNSTKLGEIPRLQEKWAELKLTPFYGKIPTFLGQVSLSVFLLRHGLQFEAWNNTIQVAQWIAQLNELEQSIKDRCAELWIPIDI